MQSSRCLCCSWCRRWLAPRSRALRSLRAGMQPEAALLDVVNRGGTVALNVFSGPVTTTADGEAGDGFLLSRGYTIVQVGWEFDARREGAIRIDLPAAAGVTGLVHATFIPTDRNATTVGDLVGYTP